METPREYYYTYYSYEEYGRGYIGSRGCKCLPEEDVKYFGSFSDKTFKPTQKIILKSDYTTREEAYADEIILHDYYDVANNPHFSNRAKAISTGFSRAGSVCSKEHRENLSRKMKGVNSGKNNPMYGRKGKNSPMYGKRGTSNPNYGTKRTKKVRKKISEALKGRTFSETHLENIKKSKNTPEQKEISRKTGKKSKGPLSGTVKEKLKMSLLGKNKGPLNGNYGKTWFTNGTENILDFECPENFWKGFSNTKNRKTWKLTFYDGSIVVTEHLSKWCDDNDYKVDNLINVKRGRVKQHKNVVKVEILEK